MAEPLSSAPVRCSVLSAERDEPMLGSAFSLPGVLLVEQPGPWGRAGLRDSRFDPEAASALERRAEAAGLRVFVVRRPGRQDAAAGSSRRRHWAVMPARPHAGRVGVSWSQFGADAELLDVPLDGSVGVFDPDPLYLVCAHSKRDVCCALRGRPLAGALQALRPGRVWECSHTGGHRFAPNLLALPVGALYGRVPVDGVPAVVAASERGEVIPELLRGMIGHPPAVQAALGRVMTERRLAAPGELTVAAAEEVAPDRWQVRLDGRGAGWLVDVAIETVATPYASCGKPAAKQEEQVRVLGVAQLGPNLR